MKVQNKLEIQDTLKVGVLPNATTSNFSVLFNDGGDVKKRTVGSIINKNEGDYLPSVSNLFPDIFNFNNSTTFSTPNLTVSLKNQLKNTVFAAPTNLNGTPSFRFLEDSDLINTSLNTKVSDVSLQQSSVYGTSMITTKNGDSNEYRFLGNAVIDTRATANSLGSDGSSAYIPNLNKIPSNTLFSLFHELNGTWYSSIITKGWTTSYSAWKISGYASTASNVERDYYLSSTKADGTWGIDRKIWHDGNLTNLSQLVNDLNIPTATDFVTTNTNQTALSGNKTTSGIYSFIGTDAEKLILQRTSATINNSIKFSDQIGLGFNVGLANKDEFAIGDSADINLTSNRWFWVNRNGTIYSKIHGNSSQWKQAYDWGRGLRVDGDNGNVNVHSGINIDANLVRNASVWAKTGSPNIPNYGASKGAPIVNFTAYKAANNIENGFSISARDNRMLFNTNDANVTGNWLELWHSGNLTKLSDLINDLNIPSSADFITTNTNQTGLSGDKTLSGFWTFRKTQVQDFTYTNFPNNNVSNSNNYIEQSLLTVAAYNNGLHFFGNGAQNSRRMAIQSGHTSSSFANVYGILELNPYGGEVKINGYSSWHAGNFNPSNYANVRLNNLPTNLSNSEKDVIKTKLGIIEEVSIFSQTPQNGIKTAIWNSNALTPYSIAVGNVTSSAGTGAVSIGYNITTIGSGSFNSGYSSTINGNFSNNVGSFNGIGANKASNYGIGLLNDQEGCLVVGRFNAPTLTIDYDDDSVNDIKKVFIVGSGKDADSRKNAMEITADDRTKVRNGISYDTNTRNSIQFTQTTLIDKKYFDDNIPQGGGSSHILDVTPTLGMVDGYTGEIITNLNVVSQSAIADIRFGIKMPVSSSVTSLSANVAAGTIVAFTDAMKSKNIFLTRGNILKLDERALQTANLTTNYYVYATGTGANLTVSSADGVGIRAAINTARNTNNASSIFILLGTVEFDATTKTYYFNFDKQLL